MSGIQENNEATPDTGDRNFRFGIMHLFYAIALVASGLAVMGPSSMGVSLLVTVFWLIAFQYEMSREDLGCLMKVLLAAFLAVGFLLMPNVEQDRRSSRRGTCLNNMRMLMIAFHNHQSAYGVFPPAYVADEDGNPRHSWRVLILPLIEENDLYDQYRFDEPWDGPNNSQLAAQCPQIYKCPSASPLGNNTIYKLVTGPETAFEDDKRPSIDDVADGLTHSIVLIEDPTNPVNWMKPEDISLDEAIKVITGVKVQHVYRENSLFAKIQKGSNAAMLDGSAISVSPKVSAESLRHSMNVRDGLSPSLDLTSGLDVVHKPQGYIVLAVYLILLALPGWFLWKKDS